MKPIKINLRSILSLFTCLSCYFPFLSPYPIGTDTQPLAHIFAFILVSFIFIFRGLFKREIVLIVITFLGLLYFNPTKPIVFDAGKYLAMFLGVLVFISGRLISDAVYWRALRVAIISYFAASIIISLFPSYALPIQSYFVRGINVSEFDQNAFSYRGVPALSTEPGLLGGLLVFLMIQVKYFQVKLQLPKRLALFFNIILLITIFLTRSGTGYLYFALFIIVSWFDYSSHKFRDGCILSLLIVGFGYLLAYIAKTIGIDNRGLEILYGLANGQTFGQDTSVLKRVFDVGIGFISVYEHPLGVGVNGVASTVNEIAFKYHMLRDVDYDRTIELVSGFGWMCVSYGYFGVLLVGYIFLYLSRAPLLHKLFAFIFFTFSYSPAFPAIWILLAQQKVGAEILMSRERITPL